MKYITVLLLALLAVPVEAQLCPHSLDCIDNPYGAGSEINPNGINNPLSPQGSEFSPRSANNPYATDPPKVYNQRGEYRGRVSNNEHHPESISNPYGRYGNPMSPDSPNNPLNKWLDGGLRIDREENQHGE